MSLPSHSSLQPARLGLVHVDGDRLQPWLGRVALA